jgi:hypothetical protein
MFPSAQLPFGFFSESTTTIAVGQSRKTAT